jgi:hypothetical protein
MFGWESKEERLLKQIRISPRKKLEWLWEMNEFNSRYLTIKTKAIRKGLRETK